MITLLVVLWFMVGFATVAVFTKAVDVYKDYTSSLRAYKLFKFLDENKTGVIVGVNNHGTLWVEFRSKGKTVRNIRVIDNNPISWARPHKTAEVIVRVVS